VTTPRSPTPSGVPQGHRRGTADGPNRKRYRGVWNLWPAISSVGVHFVLREVLNPWLNAPSDTKFWGAAVILAIPLAFAVFAFVRAIVPPKRN
jgi:hypothetical protein